MTTTSSLAVQRVRHPLKMRRLQVRRTLRLAPGLVRITLAGEDLQDFVSASFDDHVKVFFAENGDRDFVMPALQPDGPAPVIDVPVARRDYTPRRFDPVARELDIEFVLHGDGPACGWASQAREGDYLNVAGPRGSFVIPVGFDWHLLMGDESALPAIARRLEELSGQARAIAVIEVENAAEQVELAAGGQAQVIWVHRAGQPAGALERAVRDLPLPPGEGYVWAAGESGAMRAIHTHLVGERGIDKSRIRASSYWKRGAVAVHETLGE